MKNESPTPFIDKENKEMMELIESGYAGTKPSGEIVDRRKFPYATSIKENSMIGCPSPNCLSFDDVKSLTRENFWDHVWEISHGALQEFCDWIDEYKKANNWDQLFGNTFHKSTKFHDLPIAMQLGILYQFMYENNYEPELTFDTPNLEMLLQNIEEFFFEQWREISHDYEDTPSQGEFYAASNDDNL